MKKSTNVRIKINRFVLSLQKEFFKTSAICKKMLTAGRTNSHLKDSYENLGRLIESKIESGDIEVDDPRVRSYIHTIKACKKDLKEIEEQVTRIRFSSAPIDVSKKLPPKNEP